MKDCWSKKDTNKGGLKGKRTAKNATDAHNLDSTKPANVEPEVEVCEFEMGYLDADAVDLTFRTATGDLVKSGERLYVEGCDCWESISEFDVFKRRFVNHCCLLESARRWVESMSCMVTKVTCSTNGSNVAKKIDAWIQKELRDS